MVLFFKVHCVTGWFAWQSGWRCALKGGEIYRYLVVFAGIYRVRLQHSIANMTLFALSWFGNHSEPTRWRVLVITCCG